MRHRAFTLLELIGILLPALGKARSTAKATVCGARLSQLGVALTGYLNDYDNTLPQALGPLPGGGQAVIGALFGGKRGSLPFYGINEIGAAQRPLNGYVSAPIADPDPKSADVEMEPFKSPSDRGAASAPGLGRIDSYYELLGSSYTLNDHSLDGDDSPTLVPRRADGGGGKMPYVTQPSRTWVLGTHPIYNYEGGGDRGSRWYDESRVQANLLFLDMHVRIRVTVPEGIVNTTDDYTFLP